MSYYHLTIDERCRIYNFRKSGLSLREIAKALSRNVSTISRELKRNKYTSNGMYHPTAAKTSTITEESPVIDILVLVKKL